MVSKYDDDYIARYERMQIAYGLICFTSFFDELDNSLPKELRRQIGLLASEKLALAHNAQETSNVGPLEQPSHFPAMPIAFPHPTESLSEQTARHAQLWTQLAQGFLAFVQKLSFWENAPEKDHAAISKLIAEIPKSAATRFEAQYFELARKFEDFAVWANIQEHKGTKKLLESLSKYVQQYAAIAKDSSSALDMGFARLHEAVISIPEALKITQADEIVNGLKRHYDDRVKQPIAEEREEPEEGKAKLRFPRIIEAFVPQSFRVLRWTAKLGSLEDEAAWSNLQRRDDLGAFLLSYLSSPYSTEAPLVILGHPGSGKSLLTSVLAAQLMSKHYAVIRVPLREVDADAGVVAQIEEAIAKITSVSLDSWAKLAGCFQNNPPLVILDGYDELLQASGKVFSNYLKEVQAFQHNEAVQGRPARVIVTSRLTLIDKATIPAGATIVRLLEFDKRQRDRWITIWNNENSGFFHATGIKEFALPKEADEGATKILSLAEQPLLLLMLALYDSQENQLRKNKSLDRTILYNSLLQRFVARERGKDKTYQDLPTAEKKRELDYEMQRLAVAALGMYNRRKLHILSPELNEDLHFFQLERKIPEGTGRLLTQADLLLGSFFFVHRSKAQLKGGAPEQHEETAAFEFLHNTFGEFLTADFVLRQAVGETATLKALKENEDLRTQFEQRLGSADGLSRAWYASLVYTPLFTRPVVLEMIREWIGHCLKRKQLSKQEFLTHLDGIVLSQLKRLLSKREMPSIIRKETAQEGYRAPFGDHPLLGHIAIYSANLVIFRVIAADEPFVFDEDSIGTHEDGARPWDRLAHIWRSWFSLDNLNGVTAVMIAKRAGGKIEIRAKERFQVSQMQNRLEGCLGVAVSLADNITSGLAGLILYNPSKDNQLDIDEVAARLSVEKVGLELQVAIKGLSRSERNTTAHLKLKLSGDFYR